MSKIKVLHVGADNIGHGGRSTIAYNLAINMNSESVENDFLAFKKIDKNYFQMIKKNGGQIVRIYHHQRLPVFRMIETFIKKFKIMRKNEYDVVHIHADNANEALKTALIAQLAGVRGVCIHAHTTGDFNENIIKRTFLKFSQSFIKNKRFTKIACSLDAASFMYGSDISDVQIINNGIDVKKYTFDPDRRENLRSNYQLSNNFIIGCVARMSAPKNLFFLLNVFKKVSDQDKSSKLVLVGEGPLRNDLEESVNKLKISDKVIFLGNRDDVPDLMQMFDVFVLPSIFEGLGLVNIEAQAAGLPCVVSTGVPYAAKILDSFTFLDLNDSLETWAKKILEFRSFIRDNTYSKIETAHYDIVESARILEKKYCAMVKQ